MRRLLSIGAIATIAVASIAAPASAGTSTLYVDDDGTAGAAGCTGALNVPSTIADGIEAAGPGDTILVCPGRYRETIRVDVQGVTIRAVERWKAVLAPTSVSGASIVEIINHGVTLQWLKVVAPTTGACDLTPTGIAAYEVDDVQIVANRVLADPKGPTIGGSCGLANGIEVGDLSARASVRNNLVRDFQIYGIQVWNSDAKVVNNSVQYWHRSTCPVATVCRTGPGTAAIAEPTGVGIGGSTGVVALNAITTAPNGDRPTSVLTRGIEVSGGTGVRVRRNLVRLASNGIAVVLSSGATVEGNVLVGTFTPRPGRTAPSGGSNYGLSIFNSTGVRIRDNHSLSFYFGIFATSMTGATVRDNDFTGNQIDCEDANSGQNTWAANLGNVDSPVGLCTDGPIQTEPGSPT